MLSSNANSGTLPLLIAEDIQRLNEILRTFLVRTTATTAVLTSQGETGLFDLTAIAALASGAYMANLTIANLVTNTCFDSVFQQGEQNSLFIIRVDEHCLLTVIFEARTKVGTVKYFAASTVRVLAQQIQTARLRAPDAGFDLSVLNRADTRDLFRQG
jgi:predicted regulator of Ras-like GTPase activity (Roadblock/LC7/MglB family)